MAEAERWIWLGGSFLLSMAATQITWWLWRRESRPPWFERFVHSPSFPYLLQAARLLYYVGLPFAALLWGHDAVVGRLLGLQPLADNWTDWAKDVGWAVGLGVPAWVVLSVGWWATERAGGGAEPTGARAPALKLFREAAFHEVHWAFYRNAPLVALSVGTGHYWPTWIGLGLVALEAVLNPWWRASLQNEKDRPAVLVRGGLSLLSAVLFLQTENLWLALLVQWGITWGLAAWVRALSHRTALGGSASIQSPDVEHLADLAPPGQQSSD